MTITQVNCMVIAFSNNDLNASKGFTDHIYDASDRKLLCVSAVQIFTLIINQ